MIRRLIRWAGRRLRALARRVRAWDAGDVGHGGACRCDGCQDIRHERSIW